MKKRNIVFLFFLSLLALSFSAFQYFKAFQAQFVDAIGTKPTNGHFWSEMECDSAGLCVNSATGRVGIGVTDPTRKLEVNGDISSTGVITAATNVCLASGVCLSDISSYISAQPITGSSHSFNMCTTTPDANGYGEVVNIGTAQNPVWICKFDASSCPAGLNSQPNWIKYNNYSTTVNVGYAGIAGGYSCSTGGHAFSNAATESCTYTQACCGGCCGGEYCTCDCNYYCVSNTGYATVTQVGCY